MIWSRSSSPKTSSCSKLHPSWNCSKCCRRLYFHIPVSWGHWRQRIKWFVHLTFLVNFLGVLVSCTKYEQLLSTLWYCLPILRAAFLRTEVQLPPRPQYPQCPTRSSVRICHATWPLMPFWLIFLVQSLHWRWFAVCGKGTSLRRTAMSIIRLLSNENMVMPSGAFRSMSGFTLICCFVILFVILVNWENHPVYYF